MKSKRLIGFILTGVACFTIACSNSDENSANENTEEGADNQQVEEGTADNQQMEMPEPELDDVPDVVAEVNGAEISRNEFETTYVSQFQQATMQAQMSGQEIDQQQLKGEIAEALIGQELVVQEAENKGVEASDSAVNEMLDSIVEQNQLPSQEEFFAAIEEQGMTKEEILSQIETQVKVNELIANESGDLEPTKEEVQEAYENYTASLEQMNQEGEEEMDIPSFEDLEGDLKQQLKTSKETEVYQQIIEDLKADADITRHL